MKTKFFFLAFLLFSIFSFSKSNIEVILFPEYSKSMDKGYDCSASCWFNSCSGAGTCSCSCSFWSCDCEPSNPKDRESSALAQPMIFKKINIKDISVNQEQYNRTKNFADLLKSFNTKQSDNAYENLALMMTYLKNNDNEKFNEFRNIFLTDLKNLQDSQKKQINNYFENAGSTVRI